MASKNKNLSVWLWALWPIGSALITLLMLMIDFEAGILIGPVYQITLVGVLVVAAGIFITGYAAYRFAKSGVGFLKAVLIGNALPLICMAIFTVLVLTGSGESDLAVVIGSLGTGIFQILSSYFTTLIGKTLSYYEVYIAFVALVASFSVGYAIGFSKSKK